MYTITCDGFVLDDPRDERYSVESPVVNLEVNTVGEGSFIIHKNHPHFDRLKKLKSVFEVSDEIGVIFRGRMTESSADFYNSKAVDLEGVMAYFNDSTVRPYSFPEDFIGNADYTTAAESGNVIEFFLGWLIEQHNEQVEEFQRFKLGNVTVTDPNNYLSRADSSYPSTWEVLKGKLFDSALGGYLCIRYEADGNYIDYLSDFTLVNTQEIVFGENLLDLKSGEDATSTYSAIIPIGATIETETTDEEGNTTSTKTLVTIETIEDGDITDDIVKKGDTLYSRSAVQAYGWRYPPTKETTWEDVTDAENLLEKGKTALAGDFSLLTNSVECTAVDLHFTNEQVQTFRIYRKVKMRSDPHGHSGLYQLPKLGLDLHNPQSTKITVGATKRTLTDINNRNEYETTQRIEEAKKDIEENRTQTIEVKNQLFIQSSELINTCQGIFMSALESYVETSNYEEFKSTLQTELEVWAAGIAGRVTATEESIVNVNGDLQEKFNTITKYFTFDINGLTIGQVDNPNKVVIDNDQISILVNNIPVQEFKADGTALIPILKVTQMLNLLGLQITEDETNINCDFVITPLYIVEQPTEVIDLALYESGSTIVTAHGDSLSYEWQFGYDGNAWEAVDTGGWMGVDLGVTIDNNRLSISPCISGTFYFRCIVTDIYENQVFSQPIKVTVAEAE